MQGRGVKKLKPDNSTWGQRNLHEARSGVRRLERQRPRPDHPSTAWATDQRSRVEGLLLKTGNKVGACGLGRRRKGGIFNTYISLPAQNLIVDLTFELASRLQCAGPQGIVSAALGNYFKDTCYAKNIMPSYAVWFHYVFKNQVQRETQIEIERMREGGGRKTDRDWVLRKCTAKASYC